MNGKQGAQQSEGGRCDSDSLKWRAEGSWSITRWESGDAGWQECRIQMALVTATLWSFRAKADAWLMAWCTAYVCNSIKKNESFCPKSLSPTWFCNSGSKTRVLTKIVCRCANLDILSFFARSPHQVFKSWRCRPYVFSAIISNWIVPKQSMWITQALCT